MEYADLDFTAIQSFLKRNHCSCRHIADYYLKQINEGTPLNAFISIFREQTLARADEIDRKLARSAAGKLAAMALATADALYPQHLPAQRALDSDPFHPNCSGRYLYRRL